jgi:hypothetical protein
VKLFTAAFRSGIDRDAVNGRYVFIDEMLMIDPSLLISHHPSENLTGIDAAKQVQIDYMPDRALR